ncbi:histidinol dehydrogenase [Buchnera aphidicola (Nippolachnus piri)]|uniref:histidinol dehydrogenase n=1 Tax=Buchnera aphidicola TaxID=9 RepID=UPI0031B72494
MNNLLNKIIVWKFFSKNEKKKILLRPFFKKKNDIKKKVKEILMNIRNNGDIELHKYVKKFDNIILKNFYISEKDIKESVNSVSKNFQDSVKIAKKNIEIFHMSQKINNIDIVTFPGIRCQRIARPISSVGLYVPGNPFPLVSTLLMLIVPALLAGCVDITICTPPPVSVEILYIAKLCKIKKILQIGGAQAIAAMAFGTESIQKVDKIFGPGNIYVTEAKLQVSQDIFGVSIDMLAGPSEILIIADQDSNISFIVSDLLAQAEHDKNSQFFLLTFDLKVAERVSLEIFKQMNILKKKNNILKVLTNSRIILTEHLYECFQISNQYAPEHLILHIKNPRKWIPYIQNAGSVFLGKWTPEASGDYITGANHVLPTYGHAKTRSSLGVLDFQKFITIQEMTKKSLLQLSSNIITLAQIEGMDAHAQSIKIRTEIL